MSRILDAHRREAKGLHNWSSIRSKQLRFLGIRNERTDVRWATNLILLYAGFSPVDILQLSVETSPQDIPASRYLRIISDFKSSAFLCAFNVPQPPRRAGSLACSSIDQHIFRSPGTPAAAVSCGVIERSLFVSVPAGIHNGDCIVNAPYMC
ncbi:hypothetical protein NM688_g5569 [Phlebia brevispora]|uniref:Uncharacterized protein n=1 Tax=Phlebia brevispora TaxID=194682 RepID=A0ACC1ST40_9APHY|nr:hypothetical protein NM688_g5569 [Phlebia brevispora]